MTEEDASELSSPGGSFAIVTSNSCPSNQKQLRLTSEIINVSLNNGMR